MSAKNKITASLDRAAASLQLHPQREPTAMLNEALRLLSHAPHDVREAVRDGDLSLACKRLMNGYMFFGKAVAYAEVLGDEGGTARASFLIRGLRVAEDEYHRARSKS